MLCIIATFMALAKSLLGVNLVDASMQCTIVGICREHRCMPGVVSNCKDEIQVNKQRGDDKMM